MIITDKNILTELSTHLKETGQKIVTTNGCFDLLHAGHMHILREAKSMGDILFVLVNNDGSIERLKGSTRPIVTLEWRMRLLDRLDMVDVVVPFSGDTPCGVLDCIHPYIHVKGGDYGGKKLPEEDVVCTHGGQLRLVHIKDDISTSKILKV